jgi:4-diphosphocytidyl-2-C-methyl-D-erythritol kinase
MAWNLPTPSTPEQPPQFKRRGEGLLVRAPAKVNLSLLVVGKRPDGFHELETVMAKIAWFDEVLIQPGERAGVELLCQGPEWAPQGEENLVYRAAELILRHVDRKADIRLTLVKNVPAGTGLGSASSDAAATLMALNRHLGLGLSPETLADLAAQLGSDVAFFLNGPLAFCTGRGERIEEIVPAFPFTILLFLPSISVSTKRVYENYIHDPVVYESWHRQISGYLRQNRIDFIANMCANMLQRTCFHLFEELGELKEAIESVGVRPVCLSGSGSAMFSIRSGRDVEHLERQRDEIAERTGCRSIVLTSNGW